MVSIQPFCGGYNNAGMPTFADALLIPSASTDAGNNLGASNFCGQGNGFVYNDNQGAAAANMEVCCK